MYCPSCGSFVEDTANFCPVCGVTLAAPAQKKKKSALPLVLGVLVLVVLIVTLIYILIRGHIGDPKETTAAPTVSDTAAQETTTASGDPAAATEEPTAVPPETEGPTAGPTGDAAATEEPSEEITLSTSLALLWKEHAGCWTTDDRERFAMFSTEGEELRFVYGIWYSDKLIDAVAVGDWSFDPHTNFVTVHIYAPEIDEEGYYCDEIDMDVRFDFTAVSDRVISWDFGQGWERGTYAGATIEEAQPDIW